MKNRHPKYVSLIFSVLTCILLLIAGKLVNSQSKIDSLKNLALNVPDDQKANLYNQISNMNFSISSDTSLVYAWKSLEYAKKYKNKLELIKGYENLASAFAWMNQYDSSMYYANIALSKIEHNLIEKDNVYRAMAGRLYYSKAFIYQKWGNRDSSVAYYEEVCKVFKHDSLYLAHTYNSLGLVEYRYGANYEKAIYYYLAALEIAEKKNYTQIQSYVVHNIAMVYYEWDQPEKSLEYYLKSYELMKETGNSNDLGEILNSIGLITVVLGDTIAGIDYYMQALKMEEESNDRKGVGYMKNDLGYLMVYFKKYEDAKRYLAEAEKIAIELNITELIANVNKNLGLYYQKTGDIPKALYHLDKSQKIALESDISINYMNNYKMYYSLYFDQGDYEKALENYIKYSDLKDSLFTEEKHKQITELETKYETERQIKRNELLESENEFQSLQLKKNKIFLFLVIIISVLGLILFSVIFFSFKRRQKNKQIILQKESELKLAEMEKKIYSTEIEVQEKERKRFAKELHDGLGPLLSSLKLYINKITGSETSELVNTTKEILNEAITNTRNIAHDIMPIAVAEQDLIDSINKFIFRIKKTSSINFRVNFEKKLPEFKQSEKLVLYRVITELINNTIKHANAEQVSIKIDSFESVTMIEYSDNGTGFEIENVKAGLGIKNITDNVKSIGGELNIQGNTGNGMKAIIKIKE